MAVPIVIPRLGWNMEEGTFQGWLKGDGEAVRAGETIFRLESDKATEDIECLDSGVLRIAPGGPSEGDRVVVGAIIGQIEGPQSDSGLASPQVVSAPQPSPTSARAKVANARSAAPGGSLAISPRARRAAKQLGVDCSTLQGTGRTGRVREKDVLAAAAVKEPCVAARTLALSGIRRAGVERLVKSRQTTVPVTLTSTADVGNLLALRLQFQATAPYAADIVPSLNDFFIKLTGLALERHPLLAATWGEDHVVLPAAINVAFGVDTEGGLVAPVIENVPALGLRQLAVRSRELIDRGRQGKLTTKDMQGGVFTISNLGMYGIDVFTPVINHPQCAVLGIGRIRRVPVYADDKVVAQDQVGLSLTFDHRIVDGVPAAKFLQTLVVILENPGPWLMP
jgi:pyruvate dehydrogenase E2 component (dihydrolipoamide acetyltransferase)